MQCNAGGQTRADRLEKKKMRFLEEWSKKLCVAVQRKRRKPHTFFIALLFHHPFVFVFPYTWTKSI